MNALRMSALTFVVAGAVSFGHLQPATADDISLSIGAPGFAFSFNTGDVAFAYVDGYWDRDHEWHRWRDEREREEFHARYAERYDERFHDRVENNGWREARREQHLERHDNRDNDHRNEGHRDHHHDDDERDR